MDRLYASYATEKQTKITKINFEDEFHKKNSYFTLSNLFLVAGLLP